MRKNFLQSERIPLIEDRDIELLLFEEIRVSSDFRRWFVEKTNEMQVVFEDVWHKYSAREGLKIDILFTFKSDSEKICAFLIQNTHNPEESNLLAEEYRKNGQLGIEEGLWDKFYTCLLSPEFKLDTENKSHKFDMHISYENMAKWFQTAGLAERGSYKVGLLKRAIDQKQMADRIKMVSSTENFWDEYTRLCEKMYPEFKIRVPEENSTTKDWPIFRPLGFGSDEMIVHKMSRGFMDMVFIDSTIDELERKYGSFMNSEMKIKQTTRSSVIRIDIPIIQRPYDFSKDKNLIEASLEKAGMLCELYKKVKAQNEN